MTLNINTKEYWDKRFGTRDWEMKSGRLQTRTFAKEQCKLFDIPNNFKGVITDFGCGLGDAFPVYKKFFPNALLKGYDISSEAIIKCNETYGGLASFIQGTVNDVEYSDIIISSNVFEHLSNDHYVLKVLLRKCKCLYVIVPYHEIIISGNEHINSYTENSFSDLCKDFIIYKTNGMHGNWISLIYHVYLKNILRPFFGKPFAFRPKQIIFKFKNEEN